MCACVEMECSILLVLFASSLRSALAHSWAGCTDYRGDVNYFDQEKCFGFSRNWRPNYQGSFQGGQLSTPDSFANQNGKCNADGANNQWRAFYTEEYPSAVYEQGKVYCVTWPAKNHGVIPEECTVQSSKSDDGIDDLVHLYISNKDEEPQKAEDIFDRNVNELAGLATNCSPNSDNSNHESDACQLGLERHADGERDCKGFLRIPRFCESSGEAMGHGCFKVPDNLSPGHYVGVWYWASTFSRAEGDQQSNYLTCFDFEVVEPGSSEANPGPTGATGNPVSELPCRNNMELFADHVVDGGDTPTTTTSSPVAASPTASSPPTPASTDGDDAPRCCRRGCKVENDNIESVCQPPATDKNNRFSYCSESEGNCLAPYCALSGSDSMEFCKELVYPVAAPSSDKTNTANRGTLKFMAGSLAIILMSLAQ